MGVVGYRTDTFPGFYVRETEHPVAWTVEAPDEIAAIMRVIRSLGNPRALVVANPIAADRAMDHALHDEVLADGLAALRRSGVRGKDVTPLLLVHFHERTQGQSLRANIDEVLANAALAAESSVAASR